MPQHPNTVSYSAFKGIDNVLPPERTGETFLKKALNVNIDKQGGISKRKGYSLVDSGNYTSLWANDKLCLAVKNNNLIKINPDYSSSVLANNVGPDKLSFDEVDNTLYFTSNSYSGIYQEGVLQSWGIEKNNLSPQLTETIGTLPEGTYQISFTYVRNDGIESGTGVASVITVGNNAGITLFIPPHSDPNIAYARVYCSTVNGNTLYFTGIGLLNSNYTISSQSNLVTPLRVFNLDAAPKGHIVKYYNGRLYIAQDNILWYSEKYQYQHFHLDSNYLEFPEKIREIMPVEDGIWIGSDKLYYLSGSDPAEFRRSTKEEIKVVEGTGVKMSGSYIRIDNTPIGYKWLVSSDLGVFILFNQGMVINLTSQNLSMDRADSGTSVFLQDEGMNQYLSVLKTNGNPNNSVVGDLVETQIVRNGIIIT